MYNVDKFRFDKDTYVVSVKVALVEESNYVQDGTETNFEDLSCKADETQVYRTINLYSDENKSSVAYTRNVTACCTTSSCKSAGIINIQNDLKTATNSLGETYLFRFDKNKNDNTFKLVSIEKSK